MEKATAASRVLLSLGEHQLPASASGNRKSHRSIPRFCFAEFSPAASTSSILPLHNLPILIFERVEWTWLSEDTSLLSHGWTPEIGFLPSRWDYYSELMMMYLLGMGSPTHPLKPEAWNAWKRLTFEYDGLRYIGSFAPLFVHQYLAGLVRFPRQARQVRRLLSELRHRDRSAPALLPRTRQAVLRLQRGSLGNHRVRFSVRLRRLGRPTRRRSHRRHHHSERHRRFLAFLPQQTLRVLKNIRNHYGAAWSKYGFVNAFNPLKNWYDHDVIAIDTGITMLMAENLRTGFVWETFMKTPEAQLGHAARRFRQILTYVPSASGFAHQP